MKEIFDLVPVLKFLDRWFYENPGKPISLEKIIEACNLKGSDGNPLTRQALHLRLVRTPSCKPYVDELRARKKLPGSVNRVVAVILPEDILIKVEGQHLKAIQDMILGSRSTEGVTYKPKITHYHPDLESKNIFKGKCVITDAPTPAMIWAKEIWLIEETENDEIQIIHVPTDRIAYSGSNSDGVSLRYMWEGNHYITRN